SITHIPPLKREQDEWARGNKGKADEFANHLEKVFSTNQEAPEEIQQLDENLEDFKIELTTPKEVKTETKKNISAKKAPGFDLVIGAVLKELPRKGIIKFTNLIDAAFRLKYVPGIWKVAESKSKFSEFSKKTEEGSICLQGSSIHPTEKRKTSGRNMPVGPPVYSSA
ncbi:hypothetical protein ILUMI_22521, partial [Ignelater luminosus]